MSEVRYYVQQFDGYTDGRPSWAKVHIPYSATFNRESAEAEAERLRQSTKRTYRVRKVTRK